VQGHLPEKDGILTCALVAEMVATRQENLKGQLKHLYETYGYRANERKSYQYSELLGKRVQELAAHPPRTFSGKQVVDVNTIDGLKMILEDGSWVLVRISGTEQLVRVYTEADNADTLSKLMKSSEQLLAQP
jgi:phosphoglucomutase